MQSLDTSRLDREVWRAARGYRAPTLALYDFGVYGFWNPLIWKCPSPAIFDLYHRYASSNHLEAGCGTGLLPERCGIPAARDAEGREAPPSLALIDLSPGSLHWSARRLAAYKPRTLQHNLFEPLPEHFGTFNSISLNYVLHCLPGALLDKQGVLTQLKKRLTPDGILFGSTILGFSVPHTALAVLTLRFFHHIGSFHNADDTLEDLRTILEGHFQHVTIRQVGSVALFAAADRPIPPLS